MSTGASLVLRRTDITAESMDIPIGTVTNYFPLTGSASVTIHTQTIRLGDVVQFSDSTGNHRQTVESLRIGYEEVASVGPGESCVIRVSGSVRPGSNVYLISHP